VNIVTLTGTKDERAEIIASRLIPQDFDVCITSYEMCLIEQGALKKFSFEYIIIDEAHRIKNVDSMLSQIVRDFSSRGRLLITGTPLQNNLKELFSLLNFICPEIFVHYKDLDSFLHKDAAGSDAEEEKSKKVVEALHKILRPFLLRRVKADVEKSLLPSAWFVFVVIRVHVLTVCYREGDQHLRRADGHAAEVVPLRAREGHRRRQRPHGQEGGQDAADEHGHAGAFSSSTPHPPSSITHLVSLFRQLRKVTCHPYLFDGAEPGPPYTTDEHLIQNSGKMIILDKLLGSMKEKGSRVLIFSQMSRVLDILEDYCLFRGYSAFAHSIHRLVQSTHLRHLVQSTAASTAARRTRTGSRRSTSTTSPGRRSSSSCSPRARAGSAST
jgi:SWI/SNF-related matrix-associated actin-dependent regulator of chromatin subfamily A member 5